MAAAVIEVFRKAIFRAFCRCRALHALRKLYLPVQEHLLNTRAFPCELNVRESERNVAGVWYFVRMDIVVFVLPALA